MGGTCPTISYSDENAAKAVLGTQFALVVLLTVLHIYKFGSLHNNENLSVSGFSVSSYADPEVVVSAAASSADAPPSNASDKGRRAMTSIYYGATGGAGKGKGGRGNKRAMPLVGSNKFV